MVWDPKTRLLISLHDSIAPSRPVVIKTNNIDVKFPVCMLLLNAAVAVSSLILRRILDALEALETSPTTTKSAPLGNILHKAVFPVPQHVSTSKPRQALSP